MYSVNDLFCGCGGMGLGFIKAGFDLNGAWDFDKFAVTTYKHNIDDKVLQSDITQMTWKDLPASDVWTFGFPCFVAGTLITTSEGLKPIEDIEAGDRVLTHKNRFKRVVTPMQTVKKGIYNLKVQGSPKTEVTGEHPYYVREVTREYDPKLGKVVKKFSEPFWRDVKDLTGNELVGFSVNALSENPLNISKEEAVLVGRYVADGYLQRVERPSRADQFKVTLCIGKDKLDDFTSIVKEHKLGISEEPTVYKVRIFSERLYELCLGCGKGASNKTISKQIMDLPADILEAFLDGYMMGDGCFTQGRYKAASVSKHLIYRLGQAIAKVYKVPYSIHFIKSADKKIIEGREVNQKDWWQLVFQKELKKSSKAVFLDDMLWQPIKKISFDKERVSVVYNFEVEGDNSYVANNCTVHNCQDISVAGKQAGMVEGQTRSGLVYEVMRLLKETRENDVSRLPKIILAENVKKLSHYLDILSEEYRAAGYKMQCQLYNSKYWGVPQHRERYFVVGVREDITEEFNFPTQDTSYVPKLSDFLEKGVDEKYYVAEEKATKIIMQALEKLDSLGKVHATLTPGRTEKRQNGRRAKGEEESMYTLTAQDIHGVIIDDTFGYGGTRVYDANSPTLRSSRQGLKVVEQVGVLVKNKCSELDREVDQSNTLLARDYKGFPNQAHMAIIERYELEEPLRLCGMFDTEKSKHQAGSVYHVGGISPTLDTAQGGYRQPSIINGRRVRRLTPKEYGVLQGFPMDEWEQVVSDTQAYKQFGNAVSVPVAQAIATSIREFLTKINLS